MYVVDYGTARINLTRIQQGQLPYEFPPETGAVWRITATDGDAGTDPDQATAGTEEDVVEEILTPEATPGTDEDVVDDLLTPEAPKSDRQ